MTVPSTLRLQIEEIVRRHDTARVDKEEAHFNQMKAQSLPNSYYANQTFDRDRQLAKDETINKAVEAFDKVFWAIRDGRFERGDVKTQVNSSHWSAYNFELKNMVTSQKSRHDIFVDMGIRMMFQGHAGIRLSGDPEGVHVGGSNCPQFVSALLKDVGLQLTKEMWLELVALRQGEYETLCQKYDALVAEIEPEADKACEKHRKKIDKNRARAARPDVVAKREAEARDRARGSLSKLLGGSCKSILDSWTPEELLSYLKLCQKHEYVLRQLMTWSNQTPLGSKVLELEDVTTAIEMAKVRDVMDS